VTCQRTADSISYGRKNMLANAQGQPEIAIEQPVKQPLAKRVLKQTLLIMAASLALALCGAWAEGAMSGWLLSN